MKVSKENIFSKGKIRKVDQDLEVLELSGFGIADRVTVLVQARLSGQLDPCLAVPLVDGAVFDGEPDRRDAEVGKALQRVPLKGVPRKALDI